jgi:hypothetical protein
MSWLLPAVLAYPLLQQYLRYQRLNLMKKKYNYYDRQALAKMTDKEAWEIINNLAEIEFPTMFEKGTSFTFRETCAHYFQDYNLLCSGYASIP